MSARFDIVIIGAGTAGLVCAIEAAKAGSTVAVVEKDNKSGGALWWSGGHMSAAGNKYQREKGIEDSIEDHLHDIFSINSRTGDSKLIEIAVAEAPKTLDWLDDLGFPWAPECPRIIYGHVPYTKERTQYGTNKALSIYETIIPLWDEYVAEGKIKPFYEHNWIDLNQNSDGRYDTVVCNSNNGKVEILGDNIVITTGGYGSNPIIFNKKHINTPLNSSAYPLATGDAIGILENIGAQFRFANYHIPSLGGIEQIPGSGRSSFNEAWAMVLTSVYRQPRDIYVNSKGVRFMAEDEINADTRERTMMKEEEWHFYVIFDEEALLERDENGNENPIIIGWNTEQIKAAADDEKFAFKSDNIKELGSKIGVPEENLLLTIDKYNDMVDQETDNEFGRTYLKNKIAKAPFYAIKVFASVLVTFGGIKVNEQLQIVDSNNYTIPGLYAAGEVLGLGATSGNAFCSGMAITPALSFGRILGQKLSAIKQSKEIQQ